MDIYLYLCCYYQVYGKNLDVCYNLCSLTFLLKSQIFFARIWHVIRFKQRIS